jgi:hypothetical protein
VTLECLLEQEVREMVGARRYERLGSRKDHLNGTYLRRLLTSMGEVETRDMTRVSQALITAESRSLIDAPLLDDGRGQRSRGVNLKPCSTPADSGRVPLPRCTARFPVPPRASSATVGLLHSSAK